MTYFSEQIPPSAEPLAVSPDPDPAQPPGTSEPRLRQRRWRLAGYFNNLGLRNKILGSVAIVVLLLGTMLARLYVSIIDSRGQISAVTHTYHVTSKADELLLLLSGVEANYRAYLLSSDPTILSTSTNSLTRAAQLQAELAALIGGDLEQRERLEDLALAVDVWQGEIERSSTLLKQRTTSESLAAQQVAALAQQRDQRQFDLVRARFAALRAAETARLNEQQALLLRSMNNLASMIVVDSGLALLFSIVSALVIANGIAARVGLVAQAARGIAGGHLREQYDLPSGGDEVGQMADAFAHMADTIRQQLIEQQRITATLREREAYYRLMAEHANDVISRHQLDSTYIYLSPACEAVLGYTPQELLGQRSREFFHPDDIAIAEATNAALIELPDVNTTTCRFRRKDGRYIWLEANSRAVRDPETGAVVELIAISRDITERKRAEQRLSAQHAITHVLASATTLHEAAPEILRALCTTLGWEFGAIWSRDVEAERLRCIAIWPDTALDQPTLAHSRALTFARGVGLPGRIWASDGPLWITDLGSDETLPYAPLASALGQRTGFGAPIRLGGEILGVLACFTREPLPPNTMLADLLSLIGSQIGQFIERQQAEAALSQSEARYRQMFEKNQAIKLLIDPESGAIVAANPAACAFYGYSRAELTAMRIMELSAHSDEQVRAEIDRACREQHHYGSVRHRLAGGELRDVETYSSLISAQGRTLLYSIVNDITARKRAEAELSRQNDYLALLHTTTLSIMNRLEINDLLETIVRWAAQLLGTEHGSVHLVDDGAIEIKVGIGVFSSYIGLRQPPEVGVGGHVWVSGQPLVVNDYDSWADRSPSLAHNQIRSVVGVPLISRAQVVGMLGMAHVDGDRGFDESAVVQLEGFAQLASIALDNARLYTSAQQELAERRRAEEELRKSESTNRALLQAIPDLILHIDQHGAHLNIKAAKDIATIAPPSTIIGQTIDDLLPPEIAAQFRHYIELALDNPEVYIFEYPLRIDDRLHEREARFVRSNEHEVLVMIRDITERRRMEAALRESEERYRSVIATMAEGIVLQHADGSIGACNASAERILGLSADQMVGRTSIDPRWRAVHEDGSPFPGEHHPSMVTLQTGKPCSNVVMGVHKPDGSLTWISINSHPLFRAGEALPYAVVSSFSDITERKQTEVRVEEVNAQLTAKVAELERHTRELTLLSDMNDLLQACLSAQEAYAVIATSMQQLFPHEAGALAMLNPSQNLVEAVAVWGDEVGERVFAPDDCWALRRGRAHQASGARMGAVCPHVLAPTTYLCIPMMARGQTIGVLHVRLGAEAELTEAKQRLAQAVADELELVLANLQLRETLRNQSIRDPLTGLYNRRYMEESLEREMRRAQRNGHSLGVIMLDVDHFKHFNDTFGHDAGDVLLREVGDLLRTHIRGEDIACRYGGEEFTIVLPDTSLATIQERAEELRAAVKQLRVHHLRQPLGPITVSLGVAVAPEHGADISALIQRADAALYRAKHAGRDRVALA